MHEVQAIIGKGAPAYAFLEEVVYFEKKLLIFGEDIKSGKLLYFRNLMQFCDVKNANIDINEFNLILRSYIKKNEGGIHLNIRTIQNRYKYSISLAFIVNPLNKKHV